MHKKFKTSSKLWIRIKKVHRFLKFIQKAQLKPYIDIECRAEKEKAKTEFKKTFFSS